MSWQRWPQKQPIPGFTGDGRAQQGGPRTSCTVARNRQGGLGSGTRVLLSGVPERIYPSSCNETVAVAQKATELER